MNDNWIETKLRTIGKASFLYHLYPELKNFSGITDEFVSWVENKLNNRPRKRLGYLTPNEKLNLLLTN